jgi:hypothetical protein
MKEKRRGKKEEVCPIGRRKEASRIKNQNKNQERNRSITAHLKNTYKKTEEFSSKKARKVSHRTV